MVKNSRRQNWFKAFTIVLYQNMFYSLKTSKIIKGIQTSVLSAIQIKTLERLVAIIIINLQKQVSGDFLAGDDEIADFGHGR